MPSKSNCLSVLFIAVSTLSLTACQAVPINSTVSSNKATGEVAKTQLTSGINAMLYQPFAYETTIKLSNANRRHALENATDEQLNSVQNPDEYCEQTHDTAYKKLLTQALENGADIDELRAQIEEGSINEYSDELEDIKQDYIECYTAYETWKQAKSQFDEIELDKKVNNTLLQYDDSLENYPDIVKELQDETATLEQTQIDKNLTAEDIEKITPKYLIDYDSDHTKLDRTKAELLNAYGLQPMTLKASGVYQPRAGKFTILPEFDYQARNLQLSINQPIYIDIHKGDIYIWADHLAPIISQNFDDKLGLAWKNKWLKLSLNDGSLPKGFAKHFIKTYLEAQKIALQQENIANFSYIKSADINMRKSLNVAKSNIAKNNTAKSKDLLGTGLSSSILSNTSYVIQHQQSHAQLDKNSQIFNQYMYDNITKAYPELIVDTETEEQVEDEDKKFWQSKFVVQGYLDYLQKQINKMTEDDSDNIQNQDNKVQVLQHYGFDSKNKLLWWQYQRQLKSDLDNQLVNSDTQNENIQSEGNVIMALTQFHPVSQHNYAYPNLPATVQTPNAKDSIELKDYMEELKQRYQQGKGAALGRIIFKAFHGEFD